MSWLEQHWDEIVAMGPIAAPVKGCAVLGCDRPKQALGLCTAHYNLARARFDPGVKERKLAHERRRRAERRESGGVAGQEQPAVDARRALPDARRGAAGTSTGRRP